LAELERRNLDEVKALSAEEAVQIMRQAGIVGAGGGGFPTYFKWKNPQPNLIVNCTESEPGYWADKMLHREYFEEFLELFDAMKTIFGIERVIMGVHFKDEEWFSRYDEGADGLYEVVHVPDKYSMGEEKTLIKNIFNEDKGKWVPRRVELPEQLGVEIVEEQALYEGAAASYSHLVERVRKMLLDGVLGDVERPGDLPGGGTLHDEVDDCPFAFAQPVCRRSQPRQFLGSGRFDNDHRLVLAAGL
jgi:hypothetical protein